MFFPEQTCLAKFDCLAGYNILSRCWCRNVRNVITILDCYYPVCRTEIIKIANRQNRENSDTKTGNIIIPTRQSSKWRLLQWTWGQNSKQRLVRIIRFRNSQWRQIHEGLALFKGTVQRDFLTPIFSQMDSSQALYSVFKDYSNLASNSMRYSRFFIDFLLLFIAESCDSPRRLQQGVTVDSEE